MNEWALKKALRDNLMREGARVRLRLLDKQRQEIMRLFPDLEEERPEEPERRRTNGASILYESPTKKSARLASGRKSRAKEGSRYAQGKPRHGDISQRLLAVLAEKGEMTSIEIREHLKLTAKNAQNRLGFLSRNGWIRKVRSEGRNHIAVWSTTGKAPSEGDTSDKLGETLRYIQSRGSATIEDVIEALKVDKGAAYMRVAKLRKQGLLKTVKTKADGKSIALYEPA